MKFDMLMPKMGESITEGTILKWLKSAGDAVTKDETILEISTDKVDSEIPAPVSGVIARILVQEGETVDVGTTIAEIETEASQAPKAEPQPTDVEDKKSAPPKEATPVQRKSTSPKTGNRFYSPVVLNMANEQGISIDELAGITGSGINGRVTKKDLQAYIDPTEKATREQSVPAREVMATQKIPTAAALLSRVETIPMDTMRKSIARHMIQSKQTSAHVSLYSEVDMQVIEQIRERNKQAFKNREGFSLTYMPFIIEATVKALKEYALLNASIENEQILVKKYYNIGIAVAVENGLIVPNLFHADEKNWIGLARAINDLAMRARSKKLLPDELANGTFSISNFGVYGTTIGFPIINQPQVAILGVGAIKKRAVVINDAIAIRPIMYLSLTIDHRLIDGAMGAQFLQRIGQLLEAYDPHLVV